MKESQMKDTQLEINQSSLYKFVTSERNIYRAIYALESYITEPYLLNRVDLKIYHTLKDKFNWTEIGRIIKKCQRRIRQILTEPDAYFTTSVFFALKKFDPQKEEEEGNKGIEENRDDNGTKNAKKGKVKFRPLHTAPIIDQICMAAMLQVLMFDDSDDVDPLTKKHTRILSDLSKSIPDNFYGNRVSLKPERIYQNWTPNYQEYNRKIVESCDKYSKSHKYEYEISLDIKEFFPSISPFYMFVKVCNTLKERYRNRIKSTDNPQNADETQETEKQYGLSDFILDFEVLKRITAKLLFLKIKDSKNVLDSDYEYYGEDSEYYSKYDSNSKSNTDNDVLFVKGIAQGLPQSYFFGNICMVDIRRKIMNEDAFKGKDYFYVDDSVIYIKKSETEQLNEENFPRRIEKLNKQLVKITDFAHLEESWKNSSLVTGKLKKLYDVIKELAPLAVKFNEKLNYTLKFHEDGKSKIQSIDAADREIKSLGGLGRNADSMTDSFYIEGDDRRVSREKMQALNDYTCEMIRHLEMEKESKPGNTHKDQTDDPTSNNQGNESGIPATKNDLNDVKGLQLKVFKRFRKIFLSRNLWLDTMDNGETNEELENWFRNLLSPDGLKDRIGKCSPVSSAQGNSDTTLQDYQHNNDPEKTIDTDE